MKLGLAATILYEKQKWWITVDEQETDKLGKLCSERKGLCMDKKWLTTTNVPATEIGIHDFAITTQVQVAVNTFQCSYLPISMLWITILKIQD